MEFDHTYNGSSAEWNSFPSPGATPTTGNFTQNVFQTPKTATFPSQFFQDAFHTPQMPAYATPRPADFATMTPQQGQLPYMEETARSNYYPSHIQGQVMPPPSHTALQGPPLSPIHAQSHPPSAQHSTAMSFDTSQMQTPPPTRGTSVKRPTTSHNIALGTPSTIASRRYMTPQHVMSAAQQDQRSQPGPMHFPQLQFSPDVYQFGILGPASAPVYPQTQLLWEQTSSPQIYQHQHTLLDDPFAPATSDSMRWPAPPVQHANVQAMSFDTPAMNSFPVQAPLQRPASAAPGATSQPHFPPPVITSASVDPSLVYSSPLRPAMPSSASRPVKPRNNAPKPDIKRRDSGKAAHQRSDTVSTVDSVSTPIPATKELRRSNTTGAVRPLSAQSTESLSRSNSVLQPPRTASPLKRVGKLPLGSISETKPKPRPSVVLTIDETGRARTETTRVDDSPTRSIRERYPGLFDSDSSDDESEAEDEAPSRNASFSFSRGEERKPKAARLDPPVENLEGLSILRSSSAASMKVTPSRAAIAAAAQLRRGGSLRKQTPSRNGQRRTASTATPSIDTCPMDIASSDRKPSKELVHGPEWSESNLEIYNRRWSMMSMDQQQSVSPTFPIPESPYMPLAPAGRLIRCSCGVSNDRGQPLIQCLSCTQFCHVACVKGLNPSALPSSFTCFLCTKPVQISKTHRTRS